MIFLNTNSLRHKIYILIIFIPMLLVSDQLWAKQTKLLILGDSLSAAYGLKQEQGWVSLLQDAWKNTPITLVNAAISGETTDGALARLPRLIKQHQPTHIWVELGGNDGLQGHPVKKMQNNLRQIIMLSKQSEATVILQQMRIPANYGKRYTTMFEASYVHLAEEFELELMPFFLEKIALDSTLMQRDGIHPNAAAQVIIAMDMQEKLGKVIFH